MNQELKREDVRCVQCGAVTQMPTGHLTEEGKKNFLCHICREAVLERRIEKQRIGSRKLLVD